MDIEEEIRKELDEAASWPPGFPVRSELPSSDDAETRLTKLEAKLAAQRDAILRLARELDDLAAKSG
jgi:hypothetical protein